MSDVQHLVAVPGNGEVSAAWSPAPDGGCLVVYAPGAGSTIDDPFGVFLSRQLPERGVSLLRFQFPYQERRQRHGRAGGPDRNEVLEATWRAALKVAREIAPRARIVPGGRSMGGRIASQVVAAGQRADALALFAYPLHPPGRPGQRRDDHLAAVSIPTLFCSGTRDAFATPQELQELTAGMANARLHLLAGADHGFAVTRSSGRTREDVWQEAVEALVGLLA